jgi:soluble lytic murein transglycosylase
MFKSLRPVIVITLVLVSSLPTLAQTSEGETSALFLRAVQASPEVSVEAAALLLKQAVADENFVLRDYAQFELASRLYGTAEYSAAVPEFYKVITDHPRSILITRSYLMLGKSYFNQNNFPQATKTFKYLADKHPDCNEAAEARFLTAKALDKQGDWKAAYLAYEETDLYHPLSYFGKQSRLAIKALKKAHKKKLPHFKTTAAALFRKGMAYFEQDDFEMAANIFNRLAREFPKSKQVGEAWLMLGRAELQINKYSSAISDLQRASRGPVSLAGRANYYLGLAYARRGYYDEAIACLSKVVKRYPESGFADDSIYWIAYYHEILGDTKEALSGYYGLITDYPSSSSVPAAIWRMGKIYYWNSDFKNASVYLHMAQDKRYASSEDSPRCYYFEAKALERLGAQNAALEVYNKLIKRFDHTYYAYRAQERLRALGENIPAPNPFNGEEFAYALNEVGGKDQEELAAIMEIWEQSNAEALSSASSEEARFHLEKYKELMNLGLSDHAADEARYLVNITSDTEKDTLQTKLGEVLIQSGEYRTPIRFADRKVKSAIIAGKPDAVPKKIWQLSYPKGYWKHVSSQARNFGLDPYLVLAVIREESRFNPRAISRSRARGLMQIMPRTGRAIAEDLDLKKYRLSKLYEPAVNIEMGTYYLSNLVKNFKNNAYLALAGYNGGPNRVKKYVKNWYNGNWDLVDIDEFIESIPSRETRIYVQKVMGSYFEYKRLYERKRS